jgi:hypothetical protein
MRSDYCTGFPSAIPKGLSPVLLLILIPLTLGCNGLEFTQRFPEVFETYTQKAFHKALVYAYDFDGAYAYGTADGYPTEKEAVEAAMLQCQVRKKLYKVDDECTVIYINDQRQID